MFKRLCVQYLCSKLELLVLYHLLLPLLDNNTIKTLISQRLVCNRIIVRISQQLTAELISA